MKTQDDEPESGIERATDSHRHEPIPQSNGESSQQKLKKERQQETDVEHEKSTKHIIN